MKKIQVEIVSKIVLTNGEAYIGPEIVNGYTEDGKAFLVIRDRPQHGGLGNIHINKAHILRIHTNIEERPIL